METPSDSSPVGPSSEMAALLARIAEVEEDVRDAKKAMKRAEQRDPEGTGSEVSACRQTLNTMGAILHDLYEEKKRLTAETAGERASVVVDSVVYCFVYYEFAFIHLFPPYRLDYSCICFVIYCMPIHLNHPLTVVSIDPTGSTNEIYAYLKKESLISTIPPTKQVCEVYIFVCYTV